MTGALVKCVQDVKPHRHEGTARSVLDHIVMISLSLYKHLYEYLSDHCDHHLRAQAIGKHPCASSHPLVFHKQEENVYCVQNSRYIMLRHVKAQACKQQEKHSSIAKAKATNVRADAPLCKSRHPLSVPKPCTLQQQGAPMSPVPADSQGSQRGTANPSNVSRNFHGCRLVSRSTPYWLYQTIWGILPKTPLFWKARFTNCAVCNGECIFVCRRS